ncbi:hypothetical protein TNCV_657281 [Trichonephila clavipes]|nr:hypothetical protein TNCV_657281 [Trichonephila clavipes]
MIWKAGENSEIFGLGGDESGGKERRRRVRFDFQRTSLARLNLIQQPVVASGEPPALQCRTLSRHHLNYKTGGLCTS